MTLAQSTSTLLALAAFAAAPVLLSAQDDATDPETVRLEDFKVTAATRTEKLASALSVTTTVVSREALDRQLAISADLGQVLAQSVPSYAPSRQKLTSRGESFRGRDPLYLVDGIPQSNPLRAGNRESLTVDPFFLEKIEVVHGSSASQGMGATGGLVNFVTRNAPATDGTASTLEVTGVTSTRFKSDGYGGKVAALSATRSGPLAVVAGATYEHKPFAFDGDGRAVGVDNVQGDALDADGYSFFAKASYDFSARHSLEVMANHFVLEQNLDWVAVAGSRLSGVTTTAARGTPLGRPAENKVTSTALSWHDRELFGGELTVNLFYQDFGATYGASDTPATRNSFRLNGVPTLDQSRVVAEKHGLRTTWVRTFPELGDLGVVTGFDYLADETAQVLVLTGRTWVPFTTYEGWSPYVQFEKPFGPLTLTSGLRYEFATLDVPDFTTIESANSTFVRGGSPTFQEPLLNFGANWRINPRVTVYGGLAQGYGMADVGRILRAINTPNRDVDDFINLDPIVTNNWEVGVRLNGHGWKLGWNAFLSTAKLGARLVANPSGIFDVVREKSETYGTELTGDFRLPHHLGVIGGYVALLEGKSDRDLDGRVDRRLPGVNISAPKLGLFWDREWSPRLSTRVQSLSLLSRDDPDNIPAGYFSGYTLFDALVTWRATEKQTLSVGVENVLDRRYITYFSQTLTGANADNLNYFAGRGRTLSVRYRWEF
jgi:iron complex outermembrane receptor protein